MHNHDHALAPGDRRRRVLWIALVANGLFMFVEAVGGVVFDSLALLADAAHMLSDVGGLAVALIAQRLVERAGSVRHTYGLQRAEVLGALLNGAMLLGVAAWIAWEAIGRLGTTVEVQGAGMMAVAVAGLAVNVVSAVLLAREAGHSVNMRGAVLHMAVDAAGSVGAIGAAAAVLIWGADWVDPAISLALVALVLWSVWSLLAATVHVLMEGAPPHIDPIEVERALAADEAVESVHHVHVWSLASETPALSAHVVMQGELSLHEAQVQTDRIRDRLRDRFGIDHATLELECHPCEPDEATGPS